MHRTWLGGGALAAVLAAWTPGALGQEALEQGAPEQETPAPRPRPVEPTLSAPAAESAADLDALVAPVALYPDALLTQVFVAATYPLDVAKADRFLDRTQDMSDKDRAQAAEAEPWDASVQILAGGFPTVLRMMAADLDWTERLGDAVIAQTDGLLDAAQRMRAQAAAAGNLETNAAQVVEVDDGAIRVAPADPEKVYVPVYDPAQAFVPATAAPAPVVVEDDDTTDWLTMGAISFGTALLVDEIFDDDDHWHGYWGHGPAYIDWDDADLYPRRDVDIDGDVNIDIDRIDADGGRIGDFDRDELRQDRREMRREQGGWEPSPDQRARAQENIARRQGARLEEGRGEGGRLEGLKENNLGESPLAERGLGEGGLGEGGLGEGGLGEGGLGEGGLGAAAAGVAAGAAGGALAARSGGEARARLEAANARRAPERKFEGAASALQPGKATPPRAAKERDRGAASLDRPRAAAETHRPKAAPPKVVNKPAKAMKPARKPPAANPAFKKQAGGARTKAASHRGARSGGGRGGLRR